MKLRAIELTNIRRFAGQTARLSGIGDGITVLCEANEFGKSTFFDALHALFFERHGSKNSVIKALQPHAGGAPEVTVEVELPEGRFRLAKRWLQRPQAQVTDATGRLIAQADEAEAWIDRIMGARLSGPSGLLWVRQGLLGLEPEGSSTDDKRERERGLTARRDLLSSVAGEIDMMTGGRRMDTILDQVLEALGKLATPTGKPNSKGEWAHAINEAQALAEKESILRPRAERLSGDLARRTEAQRTLARLSNPQDQETRANALSQAEAACKAAEAHQSRIAEAEKILHLAGLHARQTDTELAQLLGLTTRLADAEATLVQAADIAETARQRAEELAARDLRAHELHETSVASTRTLRTRLDLANRAKGARAARDKAEELQQRLIRAGEQQARSDRAKGERARIVVTPAALAIAEKMQTALDHAFALAGTQAVTIEAMPAGDAQAIMAGRPLPSGPQPVIATVELSLPGFGHLRIDPGSARVSDASADIRAAEKGLEAALVACGVGSVEDARRALNRARELDAEIAQATALLGEIAPDGMDSLRAYLARAQSEAAEALDEPEEAEDIEALGVFMASAEASEAETLVALRAAHDLAVQAGQARAVAEANRITAERHLRAARSDAGDPKALGDRIAALQAEVPARAEALQRAEQFLSTLRASAPDLATAEARLARAKGAIDQAARETSRTREELASLNATISALADEGLEEQLAALSEARVETEARASRYEAEVRALTRLRRALEEARTRARDAYFGPVLRELQPLLSILHPGGQLIIDDSTLLPASLTRGGQDEPLDILSGGTREQLAILTRLAFARLFAAAGRPVPVILDDVLVHSDDDRIEAMFDALHRTARDQQILVLTCRQRAFAALGGEKAEVQVEPS